MSNTKLIIKNNVRIFVSDFTEIAQKAIDIHSKYPLPSLVLATAVAAFGPLSFINQKNNGKLIAMIKSEGAIKSIVVESSFDGKIRALIGNDNIETEYDDKDFNDIPLILAIGSPGILEIINIINNQQYGGQVALANADIITDLVYYFELSHQIKTALKTGVIFESKTKIQRSYSAFFQLLPNHNEEDIQWILDFIKNNDLKTMELDQYIKNIEGNILESFSAHWECACSEEKIDNIIKLLTDEEIADILEKESKVEIICEFCRKKHTYTKEDIDKIKN